MDVRKNGFHSELICERSLRVDAGLCEIRAAAMDSGGVRRSRKSRSEPAPEAERRLLHVSHTSLKIAKVL